MNQKMYASMLNELVQIKLAALPASVLGAIGSAASKAGKSGMTPLTMHAGRVVEDINPMQALRASMARSPRTAVQRRAISAVGGGQAALA